MEKKIFKITSIFTKQNILKIIKSPLFLIMLISLLTRILYYSCLKPYTLYPDSQTYLDFNKNIFLGEIDASRTPVYPYFIKIIRIIFGQKSILENIVFIQDVILFLTIIVVYYIAKNIFKNKSIVFTIVLLFGCAPCILNFTHVILTEVLSLSFFVIFLALIISYIKKPNNKMAAVISLAILILVMTRPSFLFIVPIIIIFWILRFSLHKQERFKCLIGLIAIGISTILIIGYSYLNYRQNDVFSISMVSSFNQLGNITQMGLYEKGDDREIIDTISKYRAQEKNDYAWGDATLEAFRTYSVKRLDKFTNNVIKNNFGDYVKGNIRRAFYSAGQSIFSVFASYKENSCAKTVSILTKNIGIINFGFLFLLIFFDFIVLIILWVKNKEVPWLKAGIWAFVAGQTFTVIIGSPFEQWDRLIYPSIFFISIIIFYYFDIILSRTKKRINREEK